MNELAERLVRLIAAQGPMPLPQFMGIALHDPRHGYYATREPIGAIGDFVTAPEISQIFGELLGAWLVQAWRDQGAPSPARLVELGPGRGALMGDVLRVAKRDPEFLDSIEIVLVESSAPLRRRQAETLRCFCSRIRWTDSIDDAPGDRPLFLLANEFFDALPVRQFVFTARGWCERMIGLNEAGELAFVLAPEAAPVAVPAPRGEPEIGAVYEVCPSGEAMMTGIAEAIARRGGAVLIADYGYGAEAGFGDTLQAVMGHGFTPVLDDPGEADLSAHVDFAALAHAAANAGARTYGPVSQGSLLERLGIGERAAALARANPEEAQSIATAVERLTSPAQMGTLFKAMAVLPAGAPRPAGF